jgi:hypothetical protein
MKKFMKDFTRKFTKKQLWLSTTVIVSLLLVLFLQIVSASIKNSLDTQQMATRWDSKGDSTQVTCFISEKIEVTPKQLTNLEHAVDAALQEVSITAEDGKSRLWADAYSARGEVTVVSSKTSITGSAVGVGGDFFLFHPLDLLNGSFFSDDDLMQDYIILDEDAAWQLFGSNDIEGMQVTIKGVPHIIKGVIKRDSGRMNDQAGNDKITFYISYNSLLKYGTSKGINTYEIVMPNPISGFALKTIKEKIGIEETDIELVENTRRYSLSSLGNVLLEFGTRSMNQKGIIYPYWENVARGYEDILAMLLFWKGIFLFIASVIIMAYIGYRFKHRMWNIKIIIENAVLLKEKIVDDYTNSNLKDKVSIKWNKKNRK